MRISALIVSLFILSVLPGHTQDVPDPGTAQDTEAARQKLLKAADQIDMIQTNSETTKVALDGMKADIAQLKDENAKLKAEITDLQTALDKSQAAQAKQQQVLLDEVAKMVAAGKASGTGKSSTKKKATSESTETSSTAPTPAKTPEKDAEAVTTTTNSTSSTPAPPEAGTPKEATTAKTQDADNPPPKSQKGYYHIVESGETLTMICTAYRQNGINVTVSQIRKANGLTEKSTLHVGQKLFIPKPGT